MSNRSEYLKELDGITEDAFTERQAVSSDVVRTITLSIEEIRRAFEALREHRELMTGLFDEGDEPTDGCLQTIYAFIVIP